MKNKLFILRHAAYQGMDVDPILSQQGEHQAIALGKKISGMIDSAPVIWSSLASRALKTAELVAVELNVNPDKIIVYKKLWADIDHPYDFKWLEMMLKAYDDKQPLIIFSHFEYVQFFPSFIGFYKNDSGYAEGVLIDDKSISNIR